MLTVLHFLGRQSNKAAMVRPVTNSWTNHNQAMATKHSIIQASFPRISFAALKCEEACCLVPRIATF